MACRRTVATLIVNSGQFRCTLDASDQGLQPVVGDTRLFDSLVLDALHPLSASLDGDFDPPSVQRQDVVGDTSSNTVTATLQATDPSGVREIIGLVYSDLDGVPGGPGQVVAHSTGNILGIPGPQRCCFRMRAGNASRSSTSTAPATCC
jgi:hypothetical protein